MKIKLLQHQRHNIILERLQNGELLSITNLSREWDTTTKTVQRDFEKLQEGNYGIIRAEDGKRFTLAQKPFTSKGAKTAMQMLESLSADIGGEFYSKAQSALHKLQHYIASPFYARIDVEDISHKFDLIEELEDAIATQKEITFKYKKWWNPDDIKTHKYVKPYKIIIFDGFWYLLAKSGDLYIKYYLKEMRELKILEQTFVKEEKVTKAMEKAIGIWFDPSAEPFDVTLLLDSDAIVYFKRKPIKGQYLKKNADGTAELTLSVTHKREVFSILKKWLPQVKVIEPRALQEEFENMLKKYAKNSDAYESTI